MSKLTPYNAQTQVIDRNWQEWRYDYHQPGSNAPGALYHVYRIRSDGTTIDTLATYTYNAHGQIETATDGTGGVTTYAYDSTTGDLISVTYPKNSDSGPNPVYQYGRDSLGRTISVTDPLNNITSYTYDDLNRVTSVTLPKPTPSFPIDFITTYSYDNWDAVTGLVFVNQIDPNGRISKQGFDQYGQLVKSIDALNNTTTFTYTRGLLTKITDANNNETNYQYDKRRHLWKTLFPDGLFEEYTYHNDNLFRSKKDRKGQTISYKYDQLKRMLTKCYAALGSYDACPGSALRHTYAYTGQKLTSVVDSVANETHSYTYDSAYRVQRDTQGPRGYIDYTYDAADRVFTYAAQNGPNATYTYYDDGSLKTITWSAISGQFIYQYNLRGQYNSITFPNGQHRDFSYDDQGRLTQIANIHPSAGNLATYAYSYDVDNFTGQNTMLGQRTSMNATVPAQEFLNHQTKYYYDSDYQLKQTDYPNVAPFNGEVHQWTYDAIGNRLTNTINSNTQTYTYVPNGSSQNTQKLQSDSVYSYLYDNNGSVLSKTGPEGTYNFTWGKDNELTNITGPSVTGTYSYDYKGRRRSKDSGAGATTMLYVGQNLIAERGTLSADFLFGPGIDEPLAMVRAGTQYYFVSDALGSIALLNDSAGTVQNSYIFDGWAVTRNQYTPMSNPFGYTAREFSEAGLIYYRARYYNPNIGRFVGEDPYHFLTLDFAEVSALHFSLMSRKDEYLDESLDADINLYRYVRNAPILFIDPTGQQFGGGGASGGWSSPTSGGFPPPPSPPSKCDIVCVRHKPEPWQRLWPFPQTLRCKYWCSDGSPFEYNYHFIWFEPLPSGCPKYRHLPFGCCY